VASNTASENTASETVLATASFIDYLRGSPGRECSLCETLGRDYRDAMIAHLQAVDEWELAQFLEDGRGSMELEAVASRAARVRDEVRLAAAEHEETHRARMGI
jgi:hypothetical protein